MKKLLPVLLTLCCIAGLYMKSPYARRGETTVALIAPKISDVRDTVLLQGTVVDPAPIRLYPSGTAQVLEILVEPGQQVHAGQALLRLQAVSAEPQEAAAAVLSRLQLSLEAGEVEAVKNMLDSLRLESENAQNSCEVYTLYSPSDGWVMELSAATGDTVSAMLPCITLCDPTGLLIEAYSEEDTIGRLVQNMSCEVVIPAFETEKLAGHIQSILPYAKQTVSLTGNSAAKTTLRVSLDENGAGALYPGYRAEVRVITDYRKAVLLVPYSAVKQDEEGQEYVIKLEDHIAVKQVILTGAELSEYLEITDGLTAEDVLLLDADALSEGAVVRYDME